MPMIEIGADIESSIDSEGNPKGPGIFTQQKRIKLNDKF